METRTYTAQFEVGERVKVSRPDYEIFYGKGAKHPLEGKTGTVLKVIFPGEILYEFAGEGYTNGTGAIQYLVQLDVPKNGTTGRYHLSLKELVKAEEND